MARSTPVIINTAKTRNTSLYLAIFESSLIFALAIRFLHILTLHFSLSHSRLTIFHDQKLGLAFMNLFFTLRAC